MTFYEIAYGVTIITIIGCLVKYLPNAIDKRIAAAQEQKNSVEWSRLIRAVNGTSRDRNPS